jgi:hypothetical protein
MLRMGAVTDGDRAVVDALALDLGVVAHLLRDEAVAGGLAALLAQPEDVCIDAGGDGAVVVDESEHLLLVWRPARASVEKVVVGARHNLLLLEAAWVAWNRRVPVRVL